MTLPWRLNKSLKQKYRDDSSRHVFPLDTWKVEAAPDERPVIAMLSAGHKFEVSFVTKPYTNHLLARALDASAEVRADLMP